MGEHGDQRGLAHVGRLTAHVGAGDDQHAPSLVEFQVIRHKCRLTEALDHRMAAATDAQHRLFTQQRLTPAQRYRAFGQRSQGIDGREGGGGTLQCTQPVSQLCQQLLIQFTLACQRFLACPEHAILEALKLRSDEALGGLDSLAAQIIGGHALGLRARDLDEKPLDAVKAELQPGYARALALALLQFQQELIGVFGDVP